MGEAAAPAVPILIRLYDEDTDWYVRFSVLEGLGGIGPPAAAAVPLLIRVGEREKDRVLQLLAVVSLGQIGPAARAAVPLLEAIVADPYPGVPANLRAAAKKSLAQIRGEPPP